MKRYKVGETFEYKGMILKAVEDHFNQVERGCKYCALNNISCCDIDCGTIFPPYIRFVEVSKEELITNALPIIQDVVPLPPLEDKTDFLDGLDLKSEKKSFWKRLMFWRKNV